MKGLIRIGTRGSKLALWQADFIKQLVLAKFPDINTEISVIKTTGDKVLDSPLADIGGKGVFVKEIEEALLSGQIDIAVHSMKDLPGELPDGLTIGAVAKRHDPRDALISNSGLRLSELPAGARVGTGSLRRASQMLNANPGVTILPIRGNVDTRIRKLRESGEYDAIVLAMAGLERMGMLGEVTEALDVDTVIPAPGQGIIAIECRSGDEGTFEVLSSINNGDTDCQARAERSFLRALSGDCNVPAGAYAWLSGDAIHMKGIISSPDGSQVVRHEITGSVRDPEAVGKELAEGLLEKGGASILAALRD